MSQHQTYAHQAAVHIAPMGRVVARLFERLALAYGAQFSRSLAPGVPTDDVRAAWVAELTIFNTPDGLSRMAWALENLPEFPPSLMQFKALVRRAPRTEPLLKLPEPAHPEVVAAGRAKLGELLTRLNQRRHPRQWIEDLRQREADGEILSAAQRDALRQAEINSRNNSLEE